MLLGGKCREKIRCYQAANSPEQAQQLISRYGYTALKATLANSKAISFNVQVRDFARRAEAIRKAVGPDIDLCFDAHARVFEPYVAQAMCEA